MAIILDNWRGKPTQFWKETIHYLDHIQFQSIKWKTSKLLLSYNKRLFIFDTLVYWYTGILINMICGWTCVWSDSLPLTRCVPLCSCSNPVNYLFIHWYIDKLDVWWTCHWHAFGPIPISLLHCRCVPLWSRSNPVNNLLIHWYIDKHDVWVNMNSLQLIRCVP